MGYFDSKTYNDLISSRDYYKAANYIQLAMIDNNNISNAQKEKLVREIKKLNREGDIQNAYLSKFDEQGKQAYFFANALQENSALPTTDINGNYNAYTKKYQDLKEGLRIDFAGDELDGQKIDKLRIDFTDDGYNSFLYSLNLTSLDNNDLDLTYAHKNGKHSVYIPTSSINLHKVLKATYDLDKYWSTVFSKAGQGALIWGSVGATAGGAATAAIGSAAGPLGTGAGYIAGEGIGGLAGLIGGGLTYGIEAAVNYQTPFEIKGMVGNMAYGDHRFTSDNLKKIVALGNEAIELNNKNKAEVESVIDESEMTITPFMGHTDMLLAQYAEQGKISPTDYKTLREMLTDRYDMILKGTDLTQTPVYLAEADKNDNFVFRKMEKNQDRLEMNKILSNAIKDKRVTYQAGIFGGKMGTQITISPEDKNNEIYTENKGRYIKLFVPELFIEEASNLFESDNEYRAQRDGADLKHLNYSKRLVNGNSVGHDKNIGFYIDTKDGNGNLIKVPVAEEDALLLLNRDNLIGDAAETLLNQAHDKNLSDDILYKQLEAISAIITNNIYPKGTINEKERAYQQGLVYIELRNLLQLNL